MQLYGSEIFSLVYSGRHITTKMSTTRQNLILQLPSFYKAWTYYL